MPSPRIKICGIGLYVFVSISQQTMGVEDKLVWGKENGTKRAFDAFGSRGVVSRWHKLSSASPCTFMIYLK